MAVEDDIYDHPRPISFEVPAEAGWLAAPLEPAELRRAFRVTTDHVQFVLLRRLDALLRLAAALPCAHRTLHDCALLDDAREADEQITLRLVDDERGGRPARASSSS